MLNLQKRRSGAISGETSRGDNGNKINKVNAIEYVGPMKDGQRLPIPGGVMIYQETKLLKPPDEKKEEQRRTTEAKKRFLGYLRETMGIISIACAQTGVSRGAYYKWVNQDPEFAAEVDEIMQEQLGEVEDKLLMATMRSEPWAIMFLLKNKHPAYIPKQANFNRNVPPGKTLEDLIDDYETRQPDLDRAIAQNPGQTRLPGSVKTEQSAAPLLGKSAGAT